LTAYLTANTHSTARGERRPPRSPPALRPGARARRYWLSRGFASG